MLIHLYSNQQAYGDNEVWCGEVDTVGEPSKATCLECLSAARAYGDECVTRKCELLDAAAREARNA